VLIRPGLRFSLEIKLAKFQDYKSVGRQVYIVPEEQYVHKILGYGLVDVKTGLGGTLADDRFDPNGYILNWEGRENWTREGYLEYLKEEQTKTLLRTVPDLIDLECDHLNGDGEYWEPYQSIWYNNEYGLKNVLCLIPPTMCKAYYRCGNSLDWMEETEIYEQKNRYVIFDRPIYPHDDYMDSRTGIAIHDSRLYEFLRTYNTLKQVESGKRVYTSSRSCESEKESLNRLAIKLGFDHYLHAIQHIKPYIPDSLHLLCDYCRIFRDKQTIFQLCPMLYVYWS
jgi:hypothetical protein